MKQLLILVLLFVGLNISFAQQSWDIDKAHSSVKFGVTHMVISTVEGSFKDYDAKLFTKADGSIEKLEANIKTKSIDTDNEKRDSHLRSDDFFASDKFPEMIFISKKIEKTGKNEYKITGDLTMKGVTKSILLTAKNTGSVVDKSGNMRTGWTASGTVNRFDFGLNWNSLTEAGGLVVSKEVTITINAEFTTKKQS